MPRVNTAVSINKCQRKGDVYSTQQRPVVSSGYDLELCASVKTVKV